jgi:hypothetical protein
MREWSPQGAFQYSSQIGAKLRLFFSFQWLHGQTILLGAVRNIHIQFSIFLVQNFAKMSKIKIQDNALL